MKVKTKDLLGEIIKGKVIDEKDNKFLIKWDGGVCYWMDKNNPLLILEKLNEVDYIITDQQLTKAFKGTNYGMNPNYRKIVDNGLLKVACGYYNGATTSHVLIELGLVSKGCGITKKGRTYLYQTFEKQ